MPAPALRLGEPLTASGWAAVERAMHLSFNKWDTHVGDTATLSPQPLILPQCEWQALRQTAEDIAKEIEQEEQRILYSDPLLKEIGVPRQLRIVLGKLRGVTPPSTRAMRFDFHPTDQGWRISEANTDVPGGWCEAGVLPRLFHPAYPELLLPDDPLSAWSNAIEAVSGGGPVALLCAPGFLEDQQVIYSFRRSLRQRGISCLPIQSPAALEWNQQGCQLTACGINVSTIVRFYQIEWLSNLKRADGWRPLLLSASPAVVNPTVSAISESKRFPLAFSRSATNTVWRAYAPECRDPRDVESYDWANWVFKKAYSNAGDSVYLCSDLSESDCRRLVKRAQRHPHEWVAQKRFETIPLASVHGKLYPCVGIFVVNGRATGAYARLSFGRVIDGGAIEAPVMIEQSRQP